MIRPGAIPGLVIFGSPEERRGIIAGKTLKVPDCCDWVIIDNNVGI